MNRSLTSDLSTSSVKLIFPLSNVLQTVRMHRSESATSHVLLPSPTLRFGKLFLAAFFASLQQAKTFNRILIVSVQLVPESKLIELAPELLMDIASFELSDTHAKQDKTRRGMADSIEGR